MSLILPGLIASLLIYAYIKKADVYSAFISGALEALPMLYKTLPSMCAMMAALSLCAKAAPWRRSPALFHLLCKRPECRGSWCLCSCCAHSPEAPPSPFFETFSIPAGRIPLWV